MGSAGGFRGTGATRRAFLKTLGGAAGFAALPRGAGAAAETGLAEPDVIVIGGGFAGVAAARELGCAGLRVLLLEARARLGGRTFTARVGGHHVELGGTWIHWTQPFVFAEASRYGLALEDTAGDGLGRAFWWSGGRRVDRPSLDALRPIVTRVAILVASGVPAEERPTLEAFALLQHLMERFHEGAAAALPRPFDPFFSDGWKAADTLSVKDRLDALELPPEQRDLLEGALLGATHAPSATAGLFDVLRWWALSGCDLQRYDDSVARYRLASGTASLLEAMLGDARAEVRLGAPVARVAQDGARVQVTTADGATFSARAAVVAVPLNVLSRIAFSPPLAAPKLAASKERHAGTGVKVYLRTRGRTPKFVGFAGAGEPLSTVFTYEVGEQEGVLVAFGPDPARVDPHDVPALEAFVRRFLPDLEVVEALAYDWHLDPYALGTWCVLRPGQATSYLAALREPEGIVHFAGGDIALGWRGFIDGAIESGISTGRAVAERLGAREAGAFRAERGAGRPSSGVPDRAPVLTPAPAESAPVFAACAPCHPTDASGRAGAGPILRGVVGRPAASAPGFPYSEALRGRELVWSPAELDAFLSDPAAFAPGTTMPFSGLANPADRAAVIEFLKRLPP